MRIMQVGVFLCLLAIGIDAQTRRVRVRPAARQPVADVDQEQEPQQVYFAQEPQAVSPSASYNGNYGAAVERNEERYERPTARTAIAQPVRAARVKDTPREPPVETIRNYSNINDDGSFTFGYEAADGSFKEETRGTDCVVRGKYGYVDPDGNKREFTYVSGNPCDPNAPQEDEEKEVDDSAEENVPQNIPRPIRPLRPQRPLPARPATTVFQNSYNAGNEEEDEPQQVYVQPTPARPRPTARLQPQPVVRVTPRPSIPTSTLPATTYRPQLLVSVTPRPNVVLSKHTTAAHSNPSTAGSLGFDEELKRFQLSNSVTTPRPATPSPLATAKTATPTGQPVYTSELVYDPSSGQYNTVVYQQVPKTSGEFNFKTQLPQYVTPSVQPQYATPPSPLAQQQPSSVIQQQLFQQQKQNLFQQSHDLYNQQRLQQIQSQHRFQPGPIAPAATKSLNTSPQKFAAHEPQRPLSLPRLQEPARPGQQFYYFAPQQDVRGQGLSNGQIDAFLRNHNLQF